MSELILTYGAGGVPWPMACWTPDTACGHW